MLEAKVTVNVTLAPEVMNLLKGLVGGVTNKSYQKEGEAPKVIEAPKVEKATLPIKEPKVEDKPKAEEEPKEEKHAEEKHAEEESNITLEEIRAIASKAVKKDRSAVKKLLTKYEAGSVSTLPKEKYQDFYNEVKELI